MKARLVRTLSAFALIACVLLAGLPSPTKAADQLTSDPDRITVQDDGANYEVGVEWITDWPGTGLDRPNWYSSANGLANELQSLGWNVSFRYGEGDAWERDLKREDLGGLNNDIFDNVDIGLIGTHGAPGVYDSYYNTTLSAIYYSSNNHDQYLTPGEARGALGDGDLEWVAFDACSVLSDDSVWYWHETFNGLHLMLGYANTMYVTYPGSGAYWGQWMHSRSFGLFTLPALTLTQAWFLGTDEAQPSGVVARVVAEELDNYNDYLWKQGPVSDDYPNNGQYWTWDHESGTPAPLQLAQTPATLPVYQIVQRSINEAYVKRVGAAFGLAGEVLAPTDEQAFYMLDNANNKLLRVDRKNGGYAFINLKELWTDAGRSRSLSTRDEALLRSNTFLDDNGAALIGAPSRDRSITPTVYLDGPVPGPQPGVASVTSAAQQPRHFSLSYARTLDIGNGQRLSVVGAGSRLKTYIGENGAIIGARGGWRDVQQVQRGVRINSADAAWQAFEADPGIALAPPPLATRYDRAGKPAPTLAYYEQPLSSGQVELIPVWIFVADLYTHGDRGQQAQTDDALVASNVALYVPASAELNGVLKARIVTPSSDISLKPGQPLALTSAVSGGSAPYSYEWVSSEYGVLGTEATLTVGDLKQNRLRGTIQPNTITLRVTDANGQVAVSSVRVTTPLRVHLPMMAR